ncbi:MAG: type II toxin-antitoxin system VapB family antitoxin [Lachnospiraceae bacterium]|nr:type II toxin-antitoxin system VapB family antitoxin [Lachnospiraceae bacterium]MCI9356457.1 type II toxin-antitoxin system VapB family antitoxin [Lachnospiraceae bacterium]
MATKALNFKMEETEILDMRKVASVFNMTLTDVVREAVKEYIEKMKKDPFYRLTVNVEDASAEESAEILTEIDRLTDDDLSIASEKQITI